MQGSAGNWFLGLAGAFQSLPDFVETIRRQHVRDLWRQTDLADVNAADGVLSLTVPVHGVLLYKLTPAK